MAIVGRRGLRVRMHDMVRIERADHSYAGAIGEVVGIVHEPGKVARVKVHIQAGVPGPVQVNTTVSVASVMRVDG